MGTVSLGILPLILFWFPILGAPLSVPPKPEDPLMAKIAPAECLYYMSTAGTATPDPKSPNQTEQLLAEPEVQQMAASLEQMIRKALEQQGTRSLPPHMNSEEAIQLAKLLLTHAKAVYVSEFTFDLKTGPKIRGGVIVHLDEQTEKIKSLLDKVLAEAPLQKSESEGTSWYQFQPGANATLFKFGVKDKYFMLGIGDGEIEAIVKRSTGNAPEWLEKIGRDLPVERRASVHYLNVKKIQALMNGLFSNFGMTAHFEKTSEAMGLNQITTICSVSGLDKKEFVSRSLVALDGEPRGILTVFNGKPLTESDLATIPADATFALAVSADPQAIVNTILAITEKIEPRAKVDILREVNRIQERTSVNVLEDLFSPLGDTALVYDSPSEGGLIVGATAVIKVKDAAKAKKTYDLLMANLETKIGLAKQFSQQQGQGYRPRVPQLLKTKTEGKEIVTLIVPERDFPFAPSWCLTEKELIFSLFPQAIRSRLTRGSNFQSLAELPEMKENLAEGSGVLAIGYTDTQRIFDHAYPLLLAVIQAASYEFQREGLDVSAAMLPTPKTIRNHLTPMVTTVRRTSAGIEFTSRGSVPMAGITGVPALAPLVLDFVSARQVVVRDQHQAATRRPGSGSPFNQARESAMKAQSVNNMKQITLGMHIYDEAKRTFPPAYSVDKEKKPLLSWRVLLLPYLEHNALYQEFHLDEPWDSEHNLKLIEKMPDMYQSALSRAEPGKTTYLGIRNEKSILRGAEPVKPADIQDGLSHTIIVVEVPTEKAVPWTKPDDFEYDEDNPLKGLFDANQAQLAAAFADGSIHMISAEISPKELKALFTRNGKEPFDSQVLDQ